MASFATGRPQKGEISKLQQEALARLPVGGLFIVLYLGSEPPKPNDFHWAFYYHQDTKGGTKYHIKGSDKNWIFESQRTGGIMKELYLDVLVQIGSVSAEKGELLDRLMKEYNENLNGVEGLTCRVWMLKVIGLLVENGLVDCRDIGALEAECNDVGNGYAEDAIANCQPRPVVVSKELREILLGVRCNSGKTLDHVGAR